MRGRRRRVEPAAAKIHRDWLDDARLVARQIPEREQAPAPLRSRHELFGNFPAIESIATMRREQFHRMGEVSVLQSRADRRQLPTCQVKPGDLRVAAPLFRLVLVKEVLRLRQDFKAAARQRDDGSNSIGPFFRTPPLMRRPEPGRETGHAHRTVAIAVRLVRQLAVGGNFDRRPTRVHRIHGKNLPALRLIEEQHQLPAESRAIGFGDADRERDGHAGIDRVAAVPQHLGANRRRLRMRGDHHAVLGHDRHDRDRDRGKGRGPERKEQTVDKKFSHRRFLN